MKNFKERFYNLFNILKKAIEKFPFTIIAIFILTIIYAINLDNEFIKATTLKNITVFIGIFVASAFLIETLIDNKMSNRILYYIVSAFWSLILTTAINIDVDVLGIPNNIFVNRIVRIISCFIITIITLAIYYNYKKSSKSFEEYVTKIMVNLFKTSLIYGILALGIGIITSIFIYLILSGKSYILILRMEILLLGIYYIPTILYTFYNQEEEIGKFAKVVIKYVLGTLVISAFVIIYMYILKIIILRSMPSNQIFRILSALFLCSLPIWTAGTSFKENGSYDKINRKLPFLFIPFIFLQIYAIGARIISNGITEARYLCLMLIIFEIIYVIMYWKNRTKIGNILVVFVLLTIISTVVPYINMFKVSVLSQANYLKIYTKKENYTDEEKSKIYGAYYYLEHSIDGENYIKKYINEEDIQKIENSFGDASKMYINEESIYVSNDIEYIEIGGYNRLYNINSDDYTSNEKAINIFKNTEFDIEGGNNKVRVDIEDLIKKWLEKGEDLEKHFDELDEITIDESRKIIFKYVSIRYEKRTKKILSYNISGYLLEK